MARAVTPRQRWEGLAAIALYDAKELARRCDRSRRQLERDFRRCLGRSPQDWLNEQRILAARRLLLSGLSVKAVGIELGFKQTSHFCRHLKLRCRLTPSEFVRRNVRPKRKRARATRARIR